MTQEKPKASRRKFLVGVGGAVIIAAGGATAYLLTRPGSTTTSASSSSRTVIPGSTTTSASSNFAAAESVYLSAAEKEGKVIVYSTSEDTSPVNAFKSRYPKINAEPLITGIDAVARKVESEAQAGLQTNDVFTAAYSSSGLTVAPYSAYYEPIQKPAWLADWRALSEKSKFGVPSWKVSFGFVWNSSLITQDEVPKSIYDLLDPKWKGKILWRTPWLGISANWHMTAWDVYFKRDFNAWTDYFKNLRKNASAPFIADYSQFNTAIGTGQYPIGLADPDSVVPGFKQTYPNLRFGTFKEGTAYNFGGFALSKSAPHPNAGKLLVEYTISDEGQNALVAGGISPLNPNVPESPWVQDAIKISGGSAVPNYIPRWLELLTYFDSDPVKSSQMWITRIQQIYSA